MIDAQQALAWNLVSQVVPGESLMETARGIANAIAANPPHAVRMAKRLIREGMHSRLDTVLEMSAAFQALSHQTADHREAVAAFVDKRPPVFTG
jgi:enoyl-CoA hydratase/carnithine racemase